MLAPNTVHASCQTGSVSATDNLRLGTASVLRVRMCWVCMHVTILQSCTLPLSSRQPTVCSRDAALAGLFLLLQLCLVHSHNRWWFNVQAPDMQWCVLVLSPAPCTCDLSLAHPGTCEALVTSLV